MRLVRAAFGGAFAALVGATLLAVGVWRLADALAPTALAIAPAAVEPAFAVAVSDLTPGPVAPRVEAYGWVRSGRTHVLAARIEGRVLALGEGVRPGATVEAGAVLLRIDAADQRDALDAARAELAGAEAALSGVRARARAAEDDLDMAERRRDLRASLLGRREALAARGAVAAAAVDEAALALLTAEQELAHRRQSALNLALAAPRSEIAVAQARLQIETAQRKLGDAEIRAPFAGVIARLDVGPGDFLRPADDLGGLFDPSALEVAIRVSPADLALLTGSNGVLLRLPAHVFADPDAPRPAAEGGSRRPLAAELDRLSPLAPAEGGGRELIARILDERTHPADALMPGDFVAVAIEGPPFEHAVRLPATALRLDGSLLVVGDDDRLEAASARILRREGATAIVDRVPYGRHYVRTLRWRLGPGVLVAPYGSGPELLDVLPDSGGSAGDPAAGVADAG